MRDWQRWKSETKTPDVNSDVRSDFADETQPSNADL